MNKSFIAGIVFFPLLITAVALAGPAKVKSFSVDIPEGFSGPITQSSGPTEIIAFKRPHEGRKTNALIQFSIVNLEEAPADSQLQSATITNKELLLSMLGGIESRRTDFWKGNYKEIAIAGISANKIEWRGNAEGVKMKGIYYTFIFQRHLYAISLQDIEPFAEKYMPHMEKTIESIKK